MHHTHSHCYVFVFTRSKFRCTRFSNRIKTMTSDLFNCVPHFFWYFSFLCSNLLRMLNGCFVCCWLRYCSRRSSSTINSCCCYHCCCGRCCCHTHFCRRCALGVHNNLLTTPFFCCCLLLMVFYNSNWHIRIMGDRLSSSLS